MLPFFEQQLSNLKTTGLSLHVMTQRHVRAFLAGATPGSLDGRLNTSIGEPAVQAPYADFDAAFPVAPPVGHTILNDFIRRQALSLVVHCYEWMKADVELRGMWRSVTDLPHEIILFKLLRDASAHNNNFHITDRRIIGLLPFHWRGKVLDMSWNGRPLFSDWMAYGDLHYFLEDVSAVVTTHLT